MTDWIDVSVPARHTGTHMDGPVHFPGSGAVRLLVAGCGPAGAAAAMQARELGADVTLLEAERVGGTSLNRGPAPVRTLARAARLARDWSSWESFGLEGPRPVPNFQSVLANGARVARYAHDKKDIAGHLRHNGIDLHEHLGPVRFSGPDTLCAADGRSWRADRIVIAVGCRAAALPVPGGELALTYEDIFSLKDLPRQVTVIGGADTGCQVASIFADLGAHVRLIEAGPRLVPGADASISTALGHAFEAKGIQVITGATVQALERRGEQVIMQFTRGGPAEQATTESVFAAVGWPANLRGLDLDAAAVTSGPRAIPVDDYLRTNVGHIFAVGDVNGRSKLVQSARLEGRIAAWNAVRGPARQLVHDVVPSGSFTDPEYGTVGLTADQAAMDHDIAVGIAWYDDLIRPVADGRPDGFCKLIADRSSHAILGAHVLGEYSAETVQVVATAMRAGMNVEQLAEMQFAYPTFTEAVSMAAQKVCRTIGIGKFPPAWGYLGPPE
ncbi:MAG TPA: NAD(P)/FAD-dependent oxidoreductase [Trebonia sp.]|nr:NAD(P)/FAD-dependent oxidoreductase [Trebonia sp.]